MNATNHEVSTMQKEKEKQYWKTKSTIIQRKEDTNMHLLIDGPKY